MTNHIDVTLLIIETSLREGGERGLSFDEAMSLVWERFDADLVGAVLDGQLAEGVVSRRAVRERLAAAYEAGCEARRAASWVVRFTTAPEAYDGFGTHSAGVVGRDGRGLAVRRVQVDPRHVEWQTQRYASGLFAVCDQDGFDRLIEAELLFLD